MNKEFIPYEQALKLKELGFNENCFASYTYNRHKENDMIFDIKEQNGLRWSININEQCKQYKEPCTIPLYQQAFRWFREKYGINREIACGDNVFWFRYGHNGFISVLSIDDNNGNYYSTYEEAELACLKKLIEITKNN